MSTNKLLRFDLFLELLRYIDGHMYFASPELCAHLDISRATLVRLMEHGQRVTGVRILWTTDARSPSRGVYRIVDWGVLNKRRVLAT